ncbi:PEP-CTERM sorting domain-containing protein [Aurantiacibacter xanthus]|uniref:PEP-CTERM sorting domain-containing protein n=1 Tax=Aurantiacibacter xanthus TaxID=1784712 RepID=A0A3A1PA18_9SPHN|nr:PEP-CTERM sorting domain-containing protein [Aurantiacibacter xanthus]
MPAFGTSGGFAPTPIGFVSTPTSSGGSSSGGSSSGGSSSGGTPGPVVPAVPEPASWLMMIIAVFTLGSAIRRGHANRETVATC